MQCEPSESLLTGTDDVDDIDFFSSDIEEDDDQLSVNEVATDEVQQNSSLES